MTFPPLNFNFPSSSTALSKTNTNEKEKTTVNLTEDFSKVTSSANTINPSVSQFYPSNAVKPQNTVAAMKSLNGREAGCSFSVNNSLYCKRKPRGGQVIELNPTNLQLNLIENIEKDKETKSVPLYTLKNWPIDSKPKFILCNGIGNLLAILGTTGNIFVVRLSGCGIVSEEIEIENSEEIAGIAWHPSSPADHHLAVLSRTGSLNLYDLLQAKPSSESDYCSSTDEFENSDNVNKNNLNFKLLRLVDPEQSVKLPLNRTDLFSGLSFVNSNESFETSSSWLPFTLFLVKESGDVLTLCPFLPLKFRARRQSHLLPLKKIETDPVTNKWLDEVLLSCEFVASPAGDTDWVLASYPGSFSHLQPRAHGPFLIQPEPMEIHHLASYDRVVNFTALFQFVGESCEDFLTVLVVAFGSGKIDFLGVISEIVPRFQLKNARMTFTSTDEADLPVLALLESVDLRSGVQVNTSQRSVDNRIKVIHTNSNGLIIVSTDDSIVKIDLRISSQGGEMIHNHDEENPWSIDCESTILIEKLKNHVLCYSGEKFYPGAIKLNLSNENFEKSNLTNQSNEGFKGILESVTRFAFPLGKMEIEGAAVQLEGLIENLTRTLQRLKTNNGHNQRSMSKNKNILPEAIDEIGATEFNDNVSEWQEHVVSPAMRVGHEIALRSNELVQILRREREILVRAKTLLAAKPERLERLLIKISEIKHKNCQLQDRSRKISFELGKHSVYDELLNEKLREISCKLQDNPVICEASAEFDNNERAQTDHLDLVYSQLLIQNEKLLKLKNQFKQK